jgi:L-fucose isomerase-like protein
VVLDAIIEEYQMDAIALRCWIELQEQLGISACVLLGELNNRGVPAACEVDVGNAVAMYALHLASGEPATCLDWNNNYGEEDDKCILFQCHVGRIAPFDLTFGSMLTDAGRLRFYLGQGRFTEDKIPAEFFGCAGVAEIERLQDVLLHVGRNGYRHHVSVTSGLVQAPVREALEHYLGFEVALPQEG